MYKMICIDIDGTLIKSDHTLSVETIKAIRRARDKGVMIVLSTGRMYRSARLYADELELDFPIISANGSYVRDKATSEIIYEKNLSKDDLTFIMEVLDKYGVKINFYNKDTMYISEQRDYVTKYEALSKTLPPEKRIEIKYITKEYPMNDFIEEFGGYIQKGIVFPNEGIISAIRNEVAENKLLKVVSSGDDNIEFTSHLADKGLGVLALAKARNIKPSEIICIGDSENDLSMLKVAGLAVAMGNAIPVVKEVAEYITDTNENDGVAKMINKFIFGEVE
jgi:Cof subfamily protein (haloacid dehalogenase superfamily)